jgi:predicted RNase H-like HicB family nuclease
MEYIVKLHIEKLPEGVYLATSDDVPGLVAQGRAVTETVEIARDVAKKLIEARGGPAEAKLEPAQEHFNALYRHPRENGHPVTGKGFQ